MFSTHHNVKAVIIHSPLTTVGCRQLDSASVTLCSREKHDAALFSLFRTYTKKTTKLLLKLKPVKLT